MGEASSIFKIPFQPHLYFLWIILKKQIVIDFFECLREFDALSKKYPLYSQYVIARQCLNVVKWIYKLSALGIPRHIPAQICATVRKIGKKIA